MTPDQQQRLFEATRRAVLSAVPDIWAIYVYGSVARGTERPDSDLDVALLLPPGQVLPNPLELTATLADATGREVDIADLRRAGNVLRNEVLTHGVPVYVAHPEQVLAWEAGAMSEYADHRMRIRDLLADFERTGVGYRA
jgi:predicted nucleotidyltransferase